MRTLQFLVAFSLTLTGFAASATEPGGTEPVPLTIENLVRHVPPLKHNAAGRWPMIAWRPVLAGADDQAHARGEPLPAEAYRELAKRGLCPTIRFSEAFIPAARAIQAAGLKVIVMEGRGNMGRNVHPPEARHQLPEDFKVERETYVCPLVLAGWHNSAMETRALLQKFEQAGVTIDAAWLDWETRPWGLEHEWEQARNCPRCRELFAPSVLASADAFRDFIRSFRQELYSTYVAAPFREFYPKCLITNWGVVHSSHETPTLHYWGRFWFRPRAIGLFTARNPVAYGNDVMYATQWSRSWANPDETPLDEAHMDRVYTHVMLSQVSQDSANAAHWAPETLSIPWVVRYCPDIGDPKIPVLSRTRYLELLRHIWLRGADSMQIFNARRAQMPMSMIEEVADAVQVYDEVLAFREHLDNGEVMNTAVPEASYDGAVWSGLRLADSALVRAFTQGAESVDFSLQPWADGAGIELDAPPEGAYYLLRRGDGGIRATRQGPAEP